MSDPSPEDPDEDLSSTTLDTGVIPLRAPDDDTSPNRVAMRLVCVIGDDLGREFRIGNSALTIGRGDVEVALTSKNVSRQHARVFVENNAIFIEDTDSANGTYVNGDRIWRATRLQVGDRVQVGNTVLVLAYHDELEARMQQLQRVEALTSVAAGIAHDFRNYLQVITSGLDEIVDRTRGDNELQATIAGMQQAAEGATTLATRLVNIGRANNADVDNVNVRDLVEQALAMGRPLVGSPITIRARVENDGALRVSREDLLRVLVNLITNARDAMPGGGVITLSVRELVLDRAMALSHHLSRKGRFIELRVSDTGVGMDQATRARAFEPFFTTKPKGQGTGLGLAMVHAIIKRHGGSVMIDSAVGAGTTFRILLPALD